ncbi:hypothetical protein Bxe_C0546 [Paraburkholderia xenovorans LB400]|uniref:Uncharacterized protein n=1 Tax=Paraburkholderia xenovorans (strain LB400) TaxID=266265 RepID=Q13HJ3_PARXL|nr:hypothetical protein Bxe_C0546 [Paraburkholderia xenovorans LB400]
MPAHAVRPRTNCPVSNLSLQSGSTLPIAWFPARSISVQTRERVGGMINASRRLRSRDFGAAHAIPAVCPSKMASRSIAAAFPDFPGADVCENSFEELERDAQDKVQQMHDSKRVRYSRAACVRVCCRISTRRHGRGT